MDAIFHRTSIRKYQETPVEAEKIETCLLYTSDAADD